MTGTGYELIVIDNEFRVHLPNNTTFNLEFASDAIFESYKQFGKTSTEYICYRSFANNGIKIVDFTGTTVWEMPGLVTGDDQLVFFGIYLDNYLIVTNKKVFTVKIKEVFDVSDFYTVYPVVGRDYISAMNSPSSPEFQIISADVSMFSNDIFQGLELAVGTNFGIAYLKLQRYSAFKNDGLDPKFGKAIGTGNRVFSMTSPCRYTMLRMGTCSSEQFQV